MTNANREDGPQSEGASESVMPESGNDMPAANDPTTADETTEQADPEASQDQDPHAVLVALQAEVADLKDRLLRAVAETENLRRRTDREKADLRKFAAAEFARDMLGVADNLQRALAAVPQEAREAQDDLGRLLEGVDLTERELQTQFEKHGIKPVNPLGQKLDPNLHQAVVQIEDDSVEPGTVVQVMQGGYVIHDRLLRAAMVGVAKGGSKPAASAAGADGEEPGQAVDTKA